ncbi:MAG: AraC family transcriptional regulator ligand-binding domain-containing protein [Myxococcota bacterium]
MATARSNTFPLEGNWQLVWRDLGVDPRAVLRRAGLPEGLFTRGDISLTTDEYFRMWSAVEAETGSSTFAIELGEVVRSEAFHPAIFASLCSSNFLVAADRIAHYKRLVAPMELLLDDGGHEFRIELRWLDRTVEPPASLAGFELVFFTQLIRLATRERIEPLKIESLVPLEPASAYSEYFGVAPIVAQRHAITFRRSDATRPFLTANESMWRAFEPALRQRLADLDEEASFEQRVRSALLEALPGGESSMEEIARTLAVSKRTLQRRLRDEATTFQAVLNATREDLARHYLSQTKLSGAEISYLLGFEDPNSFFRAFHNWTGQTTEQARAAHAH